MPAPVTEICVDVRHLPRLVRRVLHELDHTHVRQPERGSAVKLETCEQRSVSRDLVHRRFSDRLRRLEASAHLNEALIAVVRDAWAARRSDEAKRTRTVEETIKTLGQRKTQLLERHVYDGTVDAETYALENDRLDNAIRAESIPKHEWTEAVLASSLNAAEQLLGDLPGVWNRLQSEQVPAFLNAVFPGGLTYGESGIGTADKSWLFCEESLPDGCRGGFGSPDGI